MFQQSTLKVSSNDGRNFVLLEPLVYGMDKGLTIRAIVGSTTDGASTPQEVWSLIPPFGSYWFSAVMHDAAYRDTLEAYINDTWQKVTFNFDDSNALLMECMVSQGVNSIERDIIYKAVMDFGSASFESDRQHK